MSRAQASITAVEAGIGVLLVMSVTLAFTLGVPSADEASTRAQLDTYAEDAATLLANEPPQHADQTRLSEIAASAEAFDREKDELERRVERILPPNLMFRVETAYGTAGYRLPSDVPTGEATVMTPNGDVTLRVWYA